MQSPTLVPNWFKTSSGLPTVNCRPVMSPPVAMPSSVDDDGLRHVSIFSNSGAVVLKVDSRRVRSVGVAVVLLPTTAIYE